MYHVFVTDANDYLVDAWILNSLEIMMVADDAEPTSPG